MEDAGFRIVYIILFWDAIVLVWLLPALCVNFEHKPRPFWNMELTIVEQKLGICSKFNCTNDSLFLDCNTIILTSMKFKVPGSAECSSTRLLSTLQGPTRMLQPNSALVLNLSHAMKRTVCRHVVLAWGPPSTK